MKKINLEGKRFNRLLVGKQKGTLSNGKGRVKAWMCLCDCGEETIVSTSHIISGHTKSCGCLISEKFVGSSKTHGLSKHEFYKIWSDMMTRCFSDKCKSFKNYGGRGISVCEEWKDIAKFIKYIEDNLGDMPYKYTLDRIDNDGNYEPGNIRWASYKTQINNRRISKRRK